MGRLSPGERALWFLHRLAPESGAWNLAGAIRIEGLDADALRHALRSLAERHPALRSVFPEEQGEPFRRVLDTPDFDLIEEGAPATRERLEEEACRPFDVERGPLVRARLFRSAPGEGVLLMVLHHLVADFGSLAVFLRELGGEGPHPLAPSPRGRGGKQAREESRRFWRERLAGTVPVLNLPVDRPRPAVRTWEGGSRSGRLGAEATARLLALGRSRGATLFTVLLAAFQLLLHRLSGDEEVWIGAPTSGRTSVRQAREMGYFVNPVVLRSRWTESLSFAELVDRAREEAASALAHRDWPFSRLAEEIQPVRDPGLTPLFQAMLVVHRTRRPEEEALALVALGQEGPRARIGGLTFTPFPLRRRRAQLDLTLAAAVAGGELRLTLEHDAAFDATTAERWLGHLTALLEAAGERPDVPVRDLSRLDEAERQAVLVEWNDTRREAPPEPGLHAAFEAQAARTPDAVAAACGGRRLTYREVDRRANGLAWRLRELGAGPEVRVAVCAERSPELVIALLAILKAGGAYVPLDPSHPRERREGVFKDSGAELLLTETDFRAQEADAPPAVAAGPGNLAYVLYTSGSTGRPKGVAVEHRSALALVRWALGTFSPEELAGVLASTSITFDLSVFELFVPLSAGGTVVLVPDVLHLLQPGAADGVTLVNTVPSAMTELVRLGALPATVRTVCLAGERLPGALAESVHRALPGCRVLNLYGPTEDTTYSTFAEVEPGAGREPAIGRPIDGTRVLLLDFFAGSLRPVPRGAVGELCLGGAGLARGYIGRPDLTAERFLPDAWGDEPGARLYRTGDLARRLSGGTLDLLGRVDQQVKLRGFRIEPGEVEAALAEHPSVREAVVALREEPWGDRRLLAFVTGRNGGPDPAALRKHLEERLPAPMVPSSFTVLQTLPLTSNGKIDRRALLALPVQEEPSATTSAPRDPIEESLAAIWSEVLRRDRVHAGDDFFASGGHSLLAVRVLARVREVFGVDLPLRTVFEAPTLAGLAEHVRRMGGGPFAPPLRRGSARGPAPLSFAQERLWFLHRLEPGSPAYNLAGAVHLRGPLSVSALESALGEIVRRHQALRTRFPEVDGAPVQAVDDPRGVPLPVVDLSGAPGEAERLAKEMAARPFDLASGPLLRLLLLRLGEGEHVLLLAVHHIVADGESIEVFFRELAALYLRPGSLPELPVQYADYARWQRDWATEEALAPHRAWWEGELAGAPAALDWPLSPAGASPAGAVCSRALSAGPLAALRRRRHGATLFMVLAASFQALLARWTGQGDVLIGAPASERTRRELEPLIGCLINTLVLRGRTSDDPSFEELLRRTRETVLAAGSHQDLPFERLVDLMAGRLSGLREPGRAPLVQALLEVHEERAAEVEMGEVAISLREVETGAAKLDLSLTVEEGSSGLRATLRYRSDLFDGETARRLLERWERLLHGAAADPGSPLSSLPLLSPAEIRQLLEWGIGEPAREDVLPVHQRIERRARETPDAPAVLVENEVVRTFGELERRAGDLARRLARLGVGPGTVVALFLDRSPELVEAVFGVLQSGAAYLPLDPSYPGGYLSHVLEDAGAPVVLTKESLKSAVPAGPARVISMDDVDEARSVPSPLLGWAGGESWAYVLYTSGSTGRPKGVPVTHRALANYLSWVEDQLLPSVNSLPFITSPSFDASLKQLFGPLLRGRPVLLFSGDAGRRPEALLESLGGPGRRALNCVPSLWRTLLDVQEARGERSAVEGVLLLGGEAFDQPLLDRTFRLFPGLEVWNLYGPTEATANASAARLVPGGGVHAGRPVRGARLHVLDAHLQPVPEGTPGELAIGGAGLSPGYPSRPRLTAGRFVPDPFGGEPGARLYRTGDRARWRRGRLELLGRIDRQLKVRGVRIEPAEVEAALLAHPAVAECAVGVRGDRLTAWVAYRHGGAVDLRSFLTTRLPAALVPSSYVEAAALPRLPSGKLDLAALPAPEIPGPVAVDEPLAPTEERLAALFAEVLGLSEAGRHDDFFALGGHSLLATRLLSRVRSAFGVDLSLRTLFAGPTVAHLAEALAVARWEADDPPLVPVPRDRDLPLSFAQERLWFLDQWMPDSPAYHVPAAVRLRGSLDTEALRAALTEVVRRHEALRTTFRTAAGRPVQVVHSAEEVPLPRIDLAGLAGTAREAALWTAVHEEARRPFDLARGPLLRTVLFRLGDREHVLFLGLHHIVTDGWSMGVLVRELGALYPALRDGLPSPLPELPVQYADFAVWQRGRLAAGGLDRDLAWWRSFLEGAPPALELPADHPRPAAAIHRGAVEPFHLSPELTARLRDLSRRGGVTLFMTLLAAFEALLARVTGTDDLVVGSGVAQRTRPEFEGLIGFFVNMLPLRGDLTGDPAFADLLARVRRSTLEAYDHQDLPFERLVGEIDPRRDPSRNPLFQIVFILQNAPMPGLALPGLVLEPAEVATGTARFDLTLLLREVEGGVAGSAEYSADLFDAATVRRLLDRFGILLEGAAADPALLLSRLPLMREAERRQILVDWNRTDPDYPRDLCVHELFGRVAESAPGAVALIGEGGEVTYGELARRAARLAARLRALGVGPDVPVALCLERSAEMVVGLLGILQAGGAYVPLDLGYPRERLALMLADSGARIVVTREEIPRGIAGEGLRVVRIDEPEDDPWPVPPPSPARPESLAYILYTSGSTGRPKGVAVSHRSVVRLVRNVDYVGLGPGETILQLAPIPFDASTLEIWGALLNGGRLAVFPAGPVSLRELGRALRAWQVTTLFLTTGLFNQMVDEEPADLAGLRQLLTGGDVISPSRCRRVLESLPGCRLVNGYGPTEGTTFSACHTVVREDLGRSSIPIGRPIPRTTVYLLDRNLEPVPVGVPGELYAGGDGLARGYWRRPGLTAESFVPHPVSAQPGERLYRTGDLARWLPGGVLDFLGRVDRQLKIRGFRVEPGEVEAVLGSHPGVASCVVMLHGDGADRRLVAWGVPACAPGPSAADLAAWCRERLPGFMVPAAFVTVEALPLDPNGKVDREALPEPERSRPGRAFVPPRTPVEEQVAAVWAEVLGLDKVGAEDDFFELGGHSLLATQVVSRLARDFEVDLSLRAFFEEPTVAGVSLAITREQMRQGDPAHMARLLAQVRSLSSEELKALLERNGA